MIMEDEIRRAIQMRSNEFEQTAEITLIGHSLFDFWQNELDYSAHLQSKTRNNWGYAGISTKQYLDLIIGNDLIQRLGKSVFIFLGVNDIVKEPDYSPQNVVLWLSEILQQLQKISPDSQYYLLEATPINGRDNLENAQIHALNQYLQPHCPANCEFIPTWRAFCDEKGNLAEAYHIDGLHFSPQGYELLNKIICQKF